MVLYQIYLPSDMELFVRERFGEIPNVRYLPAQSRRDFFAAGVRKLNTEYVILTDSRLCYERSAFFWLYRLISGSQADILTASVLGGGSIMRANTVCASLIRRLVSGVQILGAGRLRGGAPGSRILRTGFLRENGGLDNGKDDAFARSLYRRGRHSATTRFLILKNEEPTDR